MKLTSLSSFVKNGLSVVRSLSQDIDMREAVKDTVAALLLRMIGSILALMFNIVIARLLGAGGAGLYFITFSMLAISSVIARLGVDNALLRFISAQYSNNEWDRLRATHELGLRMVVVGSIAASIILISLSQWIAIKLFNKPDLVEPLRWMGLAILPFSLINIQAESLKAVAKLRTAIFVQAVGTPLVSLVILLILGGVSSVTDVTKAYAAASAVTMFLALYAWRQAVPEHSGSEIGFQLRQLWAASRPLLIIAIMNRGLKPWAPILLLGIWVSADDVGIYGAATRVSLLIGLILTSVNSALVPKLAAFHANGDFIGLGRMARRATLLSCILTMPFFLLIALEADSLMALFGGSFSQGGHLLTVLMIGQLTTVVCGPVGYLLMVSGRGTVYKNLTLISVLIQFFLIIILVEKTGPLGAAIASSLALTTLNIFAFLRVYEELGISTVSGFRGRYERE